MFVFCIASLLGYLIGTDSATVAGSSSRSSNASDGPQQRSSTSRGSIGAMESIM